jgi:hypothetical protein
MTGVEKMMWAGVTCRSNQSSSCPQSNITNMVLHAHTLSLSLSLYREVLQLCRKQITDIGMQSLGYLAHILVFLLTNNWV